MFDELYTALKQRAFSITIVGPRRVGKSTIMRQLIDQLITDGVPPEDILRYQLDDPYFVGATDQGDLFERLLATWGDVRGSAPNVAERPTYCFLDEVQRFPQWELYVKRLIDLKRPITFILSGSASTTMFRKSRESLLGRVKDFHLSTFSFAELLQWRKGHFSDVVVRLQKAGASWLVDHKKEPLYEALKAADEELRAAKSPGQPSLLRELGDFLGTYFLWGGFPRVWDMEDVREKQEYLLQNHVEKVIREDLMLVRNVKMPIKVERLFLHLIDMTGQEVQETRLAKESGLQAAVVHDYLRLLEATDLVTLVPKFRTTHGVKRTAQKVFATDLALRNAALKFGTIDDITPTDLGHYAETVTFRTLREWPGVTELAYYRDRGQEVDFVVSAGRTIIAIEVKYRDSDPETPALEKFVNRFHPKAVVRITKNELALHPEENGIAIPLRMFLLLFRSIGTR